MGHKKMENANSTKNEQSRKEGIPPHGLHQVGEVMGWMFGNHYTVIDKDLQDILESESEKTIDEQISIANKWISEHVPAEGISLILNYIYRSNLNILISVISRLSEDNKDEDADEGMQEMLEKVAKITAEFDMR